MTRRVRAAFRASKACCFLAAEFSVQGCRFSLCLQMHHTLLLSCFPEGWTELLCLPQFPSRHTQPMAMQGCDCGSLYLEGKCLPLRGTPCCPLAVRVLAGDGWEPEAWAGWAGRDGGSCELRSWAAQEEGTMHYQFADRIAQFTGSNLRCMKFCCKLEAWKWRSNRIS